MKRIFDLNALNNVMAELLRLKNQSVRVSKSKYYDETITDNAAVELVFSGGVNIRADYWRIIKGGRPHISSFDHHQQYGLPKPMDAIKVLVKEFNGRKIVEAQLENETGDILLKCGNRLKLQILNFTAYEVWQFTFPDGFQEYSNRIYRKT